MDFSWPEEFEQYYDQVANFAQNLPVDDLKERDLEGRFASNLWQQCADFGIQGLAAEKKYGGTFPEINMQRSVLAMQAFGYGCPDVGLGIALNAHMWAVQMSISLFGTDQQKSHYLPKMTSGQCIGAHALTEKDSGSDVFNMKTTAQKVDGGYILNGEKCLVTLAPICDVALVFANLAPEKGKWGVTGFLVNKEFDGMSRSPVQDKMGLRTVPLGKIQLNDCFVPEENRLSSEFSGFSISNHSLEYDRCCILASKLGTMTKQLENSIKFANSHERFGQPIAKFQSVSNRIADMRLRIETSKLLLYKMAWLKDQNQSAMLNGALLKLHLSENFVKSSLDYIRLHGGNGYLTEFEIERDLRDSIGGLLYAGTSDVQRNIISKLSGLS